DFVDATFLDEAFELDHVWLDVQVAALEGLADFGPADRAVEMPFLVGIRFERDVDPLNLLAEDLEVGDLGLARFGDFLLVPFEKPEVMFGRYRGEAVGQQVIAGIAGLDLDQVALLAQVHDVFDQYQLPVSVAALGNAQALRFRHDSDSQFTARGLAPRAKPRVASWFGRNVAVAPAGGRRFHPRRLCRRGPARARAG